MSSPPDFFYISGVFILLSLVAIAIILINRRRKKVGKGANQDDAPESKKWGTSDTWAIAVAILTLVSSTAIGVVQLVNSHGTPSSAQNNSGYSGCVGQNVLVKGRATTPGDIGAPISITSPQYSINFTDLDGIRQTITFRSLDTIVATSEVPACVELAIGPGVDANLTATSVQRLQYIADLMGMQDGAVKVGTITFKRNSSGNEVAAVVLAVNGLSQAVNITSLQETVTNGPKKLLEGYFFSSNQPLFVAAKTSLFTALIFNRKIPASFPPANWSAQVNINYQIGN